MNLSQEEPNRDLEPALTSLLADLLKPIRVKGLVFTKSSGHMVRGIVLTSRPNERRVFARDFKVRFAGLNSSLITNVSVDGGKPLSLRNRRGFSNSENCSRGKEAPVRRWRRVAVRSIGSRLIP